MNRALDQQLPTFEKFLEGHLDLQPTMEEAAGVETAEAPRVPRRAIHLGTRFWSPALALTWLATTIIILTTEPAPADPTAPVPAWAALLAAIILPSLPIAITGLTLGKLWGYGASMVAAVASFALAVGCFATEHHTGLYPYGEAMVFAGLTGASWAGWRRHPDRD